MAPIISYLGRPPSFSEGYADGPLPGSLETIAGTKVDLPCEHEDFYSKRNPEYLELLLAVESDERGSRLRDLTIEYETEGGDSYTVVRDDWEMITCGSEIRSKKICSHR